MGHFHPFLDSEHTSLTLMMMNTILILLKLAGKEIKSRQMVRYLSMVTNLNRLAEVEASPVMPVAKQRYLARVVPTRTVWYVEPGILLFR